MDFVDPNPSPVDVLRPLDDVESKDGILPPRIRLPHPESLETILSSTRVRIAGSKRADSPAEIQHCLTSLDVLLSKLSTLDYVSFKSGTSPGFDTAESALTWKDMAGFPHYETLLSNTVSVPSPSPEVAAEYFRRIRECWMERLEWAEESAANAGSFCSCIGKWGHYEAPVLVALTNQIMEQLMTAECSACLRSNPLLCRVWNESYGPSSCPPPSSVEELYRSGSVHLFSGRGEYLHSYIAHALTAKTIDICTCYLFRTDVASRYILLDLLPHLASRGVRVRVLFEAMTLESQILIAALDDGSTDAPPGSEQYRSFTESLPEGSPALDRARKTYLGASDLVRDFMSAAPTIAVRFWMAREKHGRYRVKNHTKCNIFDGRTVIAGGSNLVPRAGSRDTDVIMKGEVADMYRMDFESMWNAMSVDSADSVLAEEKKEVDLFPSLDGNETLTFDAHAVDAPVGHEAQIFFLTSQPSSVGEDVILRCVLGGIHQAKTSIFICMGHFNIPLPVAKALKDATERGVKVSVLANSLYSCDLRGGQRDLFLSLQQMLTVAPKVDLYVTAMKNGQRPPFLHSKYVVVDSEWTAVGSWNMWTRAAFYEKESEVFIYSESFATELLRKFEKESNDYCIQVRSPEDCAQFLPMGCVLCKGFGPFYDA